MGLEHLIPQTSPPAVPMEFTLETLQRHLKKMPMFPLPQIVFFPHTTLPLHIFEPRYRQMIRDVREHGWPIVMGNLPENRTFDEFGRPAVLPVAGVGFMSQCEELPDGRFLIELTGVARVRIVEEHPPQALYRTVAVELLEESDADFEETTELLNTLQVLILSLTQHNGKVGEYLQLMVQRAPSPGAAADALLAALVTDRDLRQTMLEQTDDITRLDAAVNRLAELLAIAARPKSDSPLN